MRYITPEQCITSRLDGRKPPRWTAALLVFRDRAASQKVLAGFDNVRPVEYRLLYNLSGQGAEPFVYEADVAGRTIVIVTCCVWGGPQAAILVEELTCLGVPLLVGYGIAGSMDPRLPRGQFVVADRALATDGTTKAYTDAEELHADGPLVTAAIAAAKAAGREMQPAAAVTVDALYRETHELMAELRVRGADIVNLETSPLYAAAAHCGARTVWLGFISDCLLDGKWHDWHGPLGDAAETIVTICRKLLDELLTRE